MQPAIWFWLIYVVALVFGGWLIWPGQDRRVFGSYGVMFILIGILGWGIFGSPIQGGGGYHRVGLMGDGYSIDYLAGR